MNANDENESLLNIFLEEAKDLLDAISATLEKWSKDLNNKSYFADLRRDLHTLKGGARMVNQPALSLLAHETESFCDALLASRIPVDRQAYEKVCANQDQMLHILVGLFPTTFVVSTKNPIKQVNEKMKMPVATKKPAVVLIVDDSVTIRTVTKNFLEHHNFIVVTAKDGLEAFEKLAQTRPNIILLDVEMPRMDGFQFAEKMRNDLQYADIPIVMITFCIGAEQKKQAEVLGIKKFMAKPYQESELLETINALLVRA